MQPANSVVVTRQEDGTIRSPEQSTREPATRETIKGKATKSLGSQQLGEGHTSECTYPIDADGRRIPTKLKQVSVNDNS